MGNTTDTHIVQYKGEFNVDKVLASVKRVREELGKTLTYKNNSTAFINVDKEIKNVEKLESEIRKALDNGFKDKKAYQSFEKMLDSFDSSIERINRSFSNMGKGLSSSEKNVLKEMTNAQKNLVKAAKDRAKEELNNLNIHNSLKEAFKNEIKKANDYETAQKAITEQLRNQIKLQEDIIENNKKAKKEALGSSSQKQKTSVANTATRLKELLADSSKVSNIKRTSDKSIVNVNDLKNIEEVLTRVFQNTSRATSAMAAFKKELQIDFRQTNGTKDISNLFEQGFTEYREASGVNVSEFDKNIKAAEAAIAEFEQRIGQLSGDHLVAFAQKYKDYIVEINKLNKMDENDPATQQRLKEIVNEINSLTRETDAYTESQKKNRKETENTITSQENLNNSFARMQDYIKRILSLSGMFTTINRQIRKTINDISELDQAFGSIAMVTSYSMEDMWNMYGQYSEMANRLGQSTKDVVASSALFFQQGLDTAEVFKLTEQTMKLATLSGTDFKVATEEMTAAIRGFNMEMDEGARVTDVYSELAANAAADVKGIAYSISKVASLASSAGMEFETTSAFLTQMIESTQESPENLGTALKTILARFTELKKNVAGTSESEFDDLDYNKVDTALKSVGISLKDSQLQFRDLDDVILELSGKWDSLDRNTQRYIATVVAGSRLRVNRLLLAA